MELNQPPVVGKKRTNWLLWLLLGAMVVVGLPILACAGIAWVGYGAVKAPVNAAVAALNADPQITAKLGTPITAGSSLDISNYNNDNGNGSAELSFNVSGPNGSASVEGSMALTAGTWRPEQLLVRCDDGTTFQLPSSLDSNLPEDEVDFIESESTTENAIDLDAE